LQAKIKQRSLFKASLLFQILLLELEEEHGFHSSGLSPRSEQIILEHADFTASFSSLRLECAMFFA
jgi:hypothetical protein